MRIRTAPLPSLLAAAACGGNEPAASQPTASPASSATPASVSDAGLAGLPSGVNDVNPAPARPTTKVPADLPIGVSPALYRISVTPGSEPTADQIALGEKLFNDARLSSDGTVSCATCHDPKTGFVDHKVTSAGVGGKTGQRNAPTVLNAMFNATQFWDGRAATLEDQAKLPILNPIEMGMKSGDDVVAKVKTIPDYATSFQTIYGHDVTYDDLARAIAAFERVQYSGSAPFDRFINGDDTAIDAQAKRGWAVFNGKGRCNECHAGNAISPLFSDQKFHNIGVAAKTANFADLAREAIATVQAGDREKVDRLAIESKYSNLGRFLVTRNTNDIGAFKTPTLRNIVATGPYMHDGSFATLYDVIDHYNKGGVANPFLDGGMQRLGLSEPEIDDLVHFLATLTDDKLAVYSKVQFSKQISAKGKRPERDTDTALGKKGDVGDVGLTTDNKIKDPATDGTYVVPTTVKSANSKPAAPPSTAKSAGPAEKN